MRFHRRHPAYNLQHDEPLARASIALRNLVAARFEPTISTGTEAALELMFAHDERYAIVGNIIIEGMMLSLREASPMLWPIYLQHVSSHDELSAIEKFVEPWLTSLTLASYANDEVLRFFSEDAGVRRDIERARAEGLYGASPLVDVMRSIGPYVYAYRFARARRVAISDENGANGAAMLAGRAAEVDLHCGNEERNAFIRRWFGTQRFGELSEARYDVAVASDASRIDADVVIATGGPFDGSRSVALARPLPLASLVSFDVDDSVEDRRFDVRVGIRCEARVSVASDPVPSGGSGGRIVLVARDNWSSIDDCDSDALRALQTWLRREGFDVRIVEGWARIDPSTVDLAHVVGHRHLETSLPLLERFASAHVPIVATPYADDVRNELPWGSQLTLFSYRSGTDEMLLDLYLDALSRRKLVAPGAPPIPSGQSLVNPELARLLSISGAVLASSAEEERVLRELYGYSGPVLTVPAYLAPREAAAVEAISGIDDFVLIHAPLEPSAGLPFLLAGAALEGLPVIFTGPVANPEILHHVKTYAGDRAFYVPPATLTPQEVEGLYARARVYAEAGWASRGLERMARAAAYGAGIVASTHGYARNVFGDALRLADPASIPSIAAALRSAWDGAPAIRRATLSLAAERCNPNAALAATATAYQLAAEKQAVT